MKKVRCIIDADGKAHLTNDSAGSAWIVHVPSGAVMQAGEPLSIAGIRIARMDLNSTLDLHTQRIEAPAAETVEVIKAGKPTGVSFASPLMSREVIPDREG